MSTVRHLCLAAFVVGWSQLGWSAGPFEELATKLPSNANALFIVNVDKILSSPAAIAGNWKAKAQDAYAAGVTILPPQASQAILAARFDLETMTPNWEAAVMKLNTEPSLATFAKASKGSLQFVDGQTIVALPGDSYVAQFGPNVVGVHSRTSRQEVARWLRQSKATTAAPLSPYLKEAYGFAEELGTPVILAFDLEDAISHEHVRATIQESETLSKMKLDVEKAVKFLTGVRGATLGVTFRDKPYGKIRVDFGDNVTAPTELAKTLLLESLAVHGASLVELYDWKPTVEGKTFYLEGHLDQGGLRRVFSLFDRPPSLPVKADEGKVASTQQKPDDAEIQATKAYLNHISDMLDDLRKKPREYPNYTVGQTGVWYENYARKIERLPTLYVDQGAAEFAMNAASNLRGASQAIRQGSAKGRIGVTSLPAQYKYTTVDWVYGYGSTWTPWGGWGMVPYGNSYTYAQEDYQAERAARTQVKTETRLNSMNEAKDLVSRVEADLGKVRQQMTAKYNTAF